MTIDSFARPPSWAGNAAVVPDGEMVAALERVLSALAENAFDALDPSWLCDWRRRVHARLEQGEGVLAFDSPCLQALAQDAFYRVFQAWCAWLGMPVSINRHGDTLKEVTDQGVSDSLLAPQRGHMTNQALAFHSDRADLTCLACWSPAAHGGEFRIASSVRVVELIERDYPHLRAELYRPMPHDLRGEGPENYTWLPILSEIDGHFVCRHIRKFNDSATRHGVSLSPAARHLLDALDAVLETPGLAAEIQFKKGALVISNNHTTLHARRAFADGDAQRRCLLRCWLASEFSRPLPAAFLPLFYDVRPGVPRGGVLREVSV